jgi:hypothetical protein
MESKLNGQLDTYRTEDTEREGSIWTVPTPLDRVWEPLAEVITGKNPDVDVVCHWCRVS